jgi:hypothetical protein
VTANLRRIPADGGAAAEEIISLARGGVTADLLGCLVRRDAPQLPGRKIRYRGRPADRAEQQESNKKLFSKDT